MQVEAKLVAELKAHGLLATPDNPNPPAPTYRQLLELEYLSNVVQETQRLYPVRFQLPCMSPNAMQNRSFVSTSVESAWGCHLFINCS